MQRKKIPMIIRNIISIIMISIILFTLINALTIKKTYAQERNKDRDNIYNIDENIYPGYAVALQNLRNTHPNWTFTLLYTDLDWTDVLMNETVANHSRSLVQGKSGEWLCTYQQCDGISHDGSSWFGASQTAVAYYMDPRNFLTEDRIFQFETLSYMPGIHTEAGVEAVIRGSFMSNTRICDYYGNPNYGEKTFAQAIMIAAQESGTSPYHIASRIKQEVGVRGSGSCSGTVGGYEGLFNFYNIGATPTVTQENPAGDSVINGLIYARNNGWTTPEIAIIEGAKWLSNSYIAKGQDSLYLQKWDVDNQYLGLYGHQYMTNIQAPTSEASTVYNSYKTIFNNDLSTTTFDFIIPMYKNIPTTISRYPSSSTYVVQDAKIVDKIGAGVYIRKTPNGDPIGIYNTGYTFLRIELKSAKEGGYTWDKVMLQDGTMGYVATQYVVENINRNIVSKSAYINTNTNLLNGPRVEANGTVVLRALYNGQEVYILEQGVYSFDGYSWARVKLVDGTVGYVPQNYVTEGSYGEKVKITCDTELALRTGAGTGNSIIKYIDIGVVVNRIEKATTQVNGYYWDKVITSDGITGYMAREKYNPYKLWLTPISEQQPTPAQTGEKIEINETDGNVMAIPSATFADIIAKYPNSKVVSGSENLGTGTIVNIDGVDHLIVKMGDVNGDGKSSAGDYVFIKNHIMEMSSLVGAYSKAADLNKDGKISASDYVLVKNYIMNMGQITL